MIPQKEKLGAQYLGQGMTFFRVWAPFATMVEVHAHLSQGDRIEPLLPEEHGYFSKTIDGIGPGDRYYLRLDQRQEFPDPASRWQPDGVHGPSAIVDPDGFDWHDTDWRGHRWEDLVFYEIHVGAFSHSGQFDGIIEELPRLSAMGITAIEIMPIAAFPGERNWGYDGVFPFAPQASYGGPRGLAHLVNACHAHGISVFLDVVYNHTGPEGSVLGHFGPYFNSRYLTPWGQSFNFDGPHSDSVREYFWQNAHQWIVDYHIDGLRLDAIHAIIDTSAEPFLRELTRRINTLSRQLGRPIYTVAESDRNDPREILPYTQEGIGFSGQWNDDFHHALHALITHECTTYYQDYGSLQDLAHALTEGYVYTGQYSAYRQRRHGRPFRPHPLAHLVVYGQNHDQVGNRPTGDRLTTRLTDSQLRLLAATVVLSPGIPLLFMGEEYGEVSPFPYFIDHSDPALVQAVRDGRAREFAFLKEAIADPKDPDTFRSAQLSVQRHNGLSAWYQRLLRIRRQYLAPSLMQVRSQPTAAVNESDVSIHLRYSLPNASFSVYLNFSPNPVAYSTRGAEAVLLNSAIPTHCGTLEHPLPPPFEISPHACLVSYLESGGLSC